jgi:rhodanese-related sulfurtransferase
MKKIASEMAVLAGLVVLTSGVHWLAGGWPSGNPVERAAATPLREGEVSAESLREDGLEGVLFVDARREDQWRGDGVPGSIHLSLLGETGLDEQLMAHAEALMNARRIVIYCDGPECSLSHDLADRLRKDYADLLGGELRVVHGGIAALRAAGLAGQGDQS